MQAGAVQGMADRVLTESELGEAEDLLERIRSELARLAGDDADLLLAYRRKLAKGLTQEERGGPMARRKLKNDKRVLQNGLCALCARGLPQNTAYVVLDRIRRAAGFTPENTRLLCETCDKSLRVQRGQA